MNMVYLGADHRGFQLKEKIKEWLKEWEYDTVDLGNDKYDHDDDYTDIAFKLGESVARDRTNGILVCGSGVGVCSAVNKVKGIRAGLCTTEKQARAAREEDDANVLSLSAEEVGEETNKKIVKIFLETVFSSEERYIRRIQEIKAYESKTNN